MKDTTAKTDNSKASQHAKAKTKKITPLMQQYWTIKSAHRDKVLLFRMGDFYEMFHDDAEIAAPILGIALTVRNKKADDQTKMCGVPHHSIEGPINRLLENGYKVAICDQVEDPKTAKGIVKRAVTRILSPGMVYDPDTLDRYSPNYLCSYDEQTISFLDTTTGESFYFSVNSSSLRDRLISVLQPRELVVPPQMRDKILEEKGVEGPHLTAFDIEEPIEITKSQSEPELPLSAERLRQYAIYMQGTDVEKTMQSFVERPVLHRMQLASSVMSHLEVFETYKGDRVGSLYHAINRTRSSGGARKLRQWLQFPLLDPQLIEQRQNQVAFWHERSESLRKIRQKFSEIGDLERRIGKLSSPNCHPRDLISLADSLRAGLEIAEMCEQLGFAANLPVSSLVETIDQVEKMLVSEPPAQFKNGQFIREGYHQPLDELIHLATKSQESLAAMEQHERDCTGIASLKIRYNNVFGYYIEVTNTHKSKVPSHYVRKQTLTNAERYITDELRVLEEKVLSARSKRVELELELFENLRQGLLAGSLELLTWAERLSEWDVLTSFSWLAQEQRYVRPKVSRSGSLHLSACRHPVVEQVQSAPFVPNTMKLEPGECLLLTGPNMAGKSTLMRQIAICAILAQVGSYVPAEKAELPLFDRIFTRIGASDFLAEGLSTFMVEMKETAEMLREANARSLVILDEVGRGTSTYDGMSLAQAILEFLLKEIQSFTLFATHYHELTRLEQEYSRLSNGHMSIHEKDGDIQFLYTLKKGPANKSYGIHVAELAGLPQSVVSRASEILQDLEQSSGTSASGQLPLFWTMNDESFVEKTQSRQPEEAANGETTNEKQQADPAQLQLLEDMKNLSLQTMTPLEAINKIAQWQKFLS